MSYYFDAGADHAPKTSAEHRAAALRLLASADSGQHPERRIAAANVHAMLALVQSVAEDNDPESKPEPLSPAARAETAKALHTARQHGNVDDALAILATLEWNERQHVEDLAREIGRVVDTAATSAARKTEFAMGDAVTDLSRIGHVVATLGNWHLRVRWEDGTEQSTSAFDLYPATTPDPADTDSRV